MAVNYELILPVVEAVLKVGVPPEKVTVYEQFSNYLLGSRVNAGKWKRMPFASRNARPAE